MVCRKVVFARPFLRSNGIFFEGRSRALWSGTLASPTCTFCWRCVFANYHLHFSVSVGIAEKFMSRMLPFVYLLGAPASRVSRLFISIPGGVLQEIIELLMLSRYVFFLSHLCDEFLEPRGLFDTLISSLPFRCR